MEEKPNTGHLASQRIATAEMEENHRRPLTAGLYLVATPIGNLRDITLRALDTLKEADLIACEDTRVTRKLLSAYNISTPTTSYGEHNADRARPDLLRRLQEGARIALVSDAGTPLLSDPGYKLVQEALNRGIAVTAVPGASALLAALSIAGQPTDRFFFAGFLPAKDSARKEALKELRHLPAVCRKRWPPWQKFLAQPARPLSAVS
jgi:16S rRNA (cytidine1402-2'-O)-methyltransferase